MRNLRVLLGGVLLIPVFGLIVHAEITMVAEHHANDTAAPGFKFKTVPPPSGTDAASTAKFTLVDGRRDTNGGNLDQLHDGRVPTDQDQPARNFFFAAGTRGGRLLIDLQSISDIKQISTYSWHPDSRGPQVYQLYVSDGTADDFESQPKHGTQPESCGWKLIAKVDTRPEQGTGGGQYGVSISDSSGTLGKYRYVLLDISRTEAADPFGNTFYSEIDIDDGQARDAVSTTEAESRTEIVEAEGGKYRITIDTTDTPDLTEWTEKELAPVVRQWYPKIVELLPSEGFEAPNNVTITFSAEMRGVAATGGTRVRCAAGWFRQNLDGEAKGAVVHELVHVVQSYRRMRRNDSRSTRVPGWLVEGIADYIRWYLYEPETGGAVISKRNLPRARYDASYRVSANFLNWVTNTYAKDLVRKLNAAAREGKYPEDLWKECTGRTIEELGAEWKADLEKKLAD